MNTPASTPRQAGASRRDPRIDFFRGVALLFIFTNHFAEFAGSPLLKLISWRTWGMSDAAELFIFLSGLVYGLVYDRDRARGGATALIKKSWRRLAQLYGANFLTFTLCVFALAGIGWLLGWTVPWANGLLADPVAGTAAFLALQRVPVFFDVLPLYIQLLLVAPFLLLLARRDMRWATAVSGAVYVVSFAYRPADWTGTAFGLGLYFNPFAWQFLFFLGLALGVRRNDGARSWRLSRGWIVVSACVLLVSLALKLGVHVVNYDVAGYGRHAAWAVAVEGWFDKGRLMPWRLLHFFALAHLVTLALPGLTSAWWNNRAVLVVRRIGECSLQIFCFGLVLSYAGWLIVENSPNNTIVQLTLNTLAWALMAAWGLIAARRRASARQAPSDRERGLSDSNPIDAGSGSPIAPATKRKAASL